MSAQEDWRPISGYLGQYEVSNFGNVRSAPKLVSHWRGGTRLRAGRILKGRVARGYLMVTLYNGAGESEQIAVHRLVASTFLANPLQKKQVNHKDGNKKNNNVENLEWATPSENVTHAFRTGLRNSKGENCTNAALSTSDVIEIRRRLSAGETCRRIADDYPVTDRAISRIKRRVVWSHI
jgi:hypothetical protein